MNLLIILEVFNFSRSSIFLEIPIFLELSQFFWYFLSFSGIYNISGLFQKFTRISQLSKQDDFIQPNLEHINRLLDENPALENADLGDDHTNKQITVMDKIPWGNLNRGKPSVNFYYLFSLYRWQKLGT